MFDGGTRQRLWFGDAVTRVQTRAANGQLRSNLMVNGTVSGLPDADAFYLQTGQKIARIKYSGEFLPAHPCPIRPGY